MPSVWPGMCQPIRGWKKGEVGIPNFNIKGGLNTPARNCYIIKWIKYNQGLTRKHFLNVLISRLCRQKTQGQIYRDKEHGTTTKNLIPNFCPSNQSFPSELNVILSECSYLIGGKDEKINFYTITLSLKGTVVK